MGSQLSDAALDLLRRQIHGYIYITPENRPQIDELVSAGYAQIWEGRVAYVTNAGFTLLKGS